MRLCTYIYIYIHECILYSNTRRASDMESAVLVRKISTEDWGEKVSLYLHLYCTYHTHIHLSYITYLLCFYLLYILLSSCITGPVMSAQCLGHSRPPAVGRQQGYQYRTLLSRPSHIEGVAADLELNCCMLRDLDCITGMLIPSRLYVHVTYDICIYVCILMTCLALYRSMSW